MTGGGIREPGHGSRATGHPAAEGGGGGESGSSHPLHGAQEPQPNADAEEPAGAKGCQPTNHPGLPRRWRRPLGPIPVAPQW